MQEVLSEGALNPVDPVPTSENSQVKCVPLFDGYNTTYVYLYCSKAYYGAIQVSVNNNTSILPEDTGSENVKFKKGFKVTYMPLVKDAYNIKLDGDIFDNGTTKKITQLIIGPFQSVDK